MVIDNHVHGCKLPWRDKAAQRVSVSRPTNRNPPATNFFGPHCLKSSDIQNHTGKRSVPFGGQGRDSPCYPKPRKSRIPARPAKRHKRPPWAAKNSGRSWEADVLHPTGRLLYQNACSEDLRECGSKTGEREKIPPEFHLAKARVQTTDRLPGVLGDQPADKKLTQRGSITQAGCRAKTCGARRGLSRVEKTRLVLREALSGCPAE